MIFVTIIFSLLLRAAIAAPVSGVSRDENVTVQHLPVISARQLVTTTSDAPAPEVTAEAAGVWDPVSRRFLFEKNIDRVYPIASVTKLMTVSVAINAGLNLDEETTITSEDNDPEGSRLPVPNGGVVTVRDLLAATLIASGNNAAEALARATGIAEAAFVAKMNERAAELGMLATRFTDVTGLGSHNESTIRDLVLLAQDALSRPDVVTMTTQKSYTVFEKSQNKNIVLENTNALVGSDLRVTGGKTGYTDAARGALIIRVRGIGEHELYILVLESAGRENRFTDARSLADWAFATHAWGVSQ